MEAVEYELSLSTGERLSFAELSESVLPTLKSVMRSGVLADVLRRCTKVPHPVLEDAKKGHTKGLESLLRTPPYGALMKLGKPVCSQILCCAIADPKKCTTRNSSMKKADFPECWEYDAPDRDSEEVARCVIHSWRQGRHVLIVSDG